jgi:5-methylcytosine-specific restriction endonuclease McrA
MKSPTKVCNCCFCEKDASAFLKQKGTCKECNKQKRRIRDEKNREHVREKQRAYARDNAEKIAARKKEWFTKNREQEIERMKEWRANNVEARREYAKKYDAEHVEENRSRNNNYRAKNRAKVREANKRWRQENPIKVLEHRRRYGSFRRMKGSTGEAVIDRTISLIGILERDNYTCHICNKHIDFSLPYRHKLSATIDHLFPISFGGKHTWDNVAAAHFGCNSKMRNKLQIP